MLRDAFERVMSEFPMARTAPFGAHPLARYITKELPRMIEDAVALPEGFSVEGSAGKGNWVEGPWVAIFDSLATEGAQDGYYPVYLFGRTLEAVYLSFNQGVTNLKKQVKVVAARR